jgi:hypothetical protein
MSGPAGQQNEKPSTGTGLHRTVTPPNISTMVDRLEAKALARQARARPPLYWPGSGVRAAASRLR